MENLLEYTDALFFNNMPFNATYPAMLYGRPWLKYAEIS